MLVSERMTRHLITVTPELTVDQALHLIQQHQGRRLPVPDATGHLVGIVARKICSTLPLTCLRLQRVGMVTC